MDIVGLAELPAALGLGATERVAFVGGGGKTTGVFALGHHRPGRRILTTTTKMGSDRSAGRALLLAPSDAELDDALAQHGEVMVWSAIDEHRALGVDPETIDRWAGLADTIAVEADGSRRRPFKAPKEYEPVIPSSTTLVVGCVGVAALGLPIGEGCHRPDRVAALTGLGLDDPLTVEALATVLSSEDGSRKAVPAGARFVALINRIRPEHHALVRELADALDGIDLVAVAEAAPDQLPDGSYPSA